MNQDYTPFDPSAGVPTIDQKKSSENQRAKYTGKGLYQNIREKEKEALIGILNKDHNIDQADAEKFVRGIPNSKFAWANAAVKKGLAGALSPCDLELFKNMWMSSDASKILNDKILIKLKTDPNAQILQNFPTRNKGLQLTCQGGQLTTNLKNPGVYNLYTGKVEHYPDYETMYREIKEYNKYDDNVDWATGRVMKQPLLKASVNESSVDISKMLSYMDEEAECACAVKNDKIIKKSEDLVKYIDDLNKQIDEITQVHRNTHALDTIDVPPHMNKLFSDFRKAMVRANSVSIDQIEKVAEALKYLRGIQTSSYLHAICDPWSNRFVKAPSEIPIPSASFSVRSNINLSTGANGTLAFAFDPYFLNAVTASSPSSFGLNTVLTGLATDNNFNAINVGQTLPAQLYGKYRLVSAGLKFTVTSSFLNTTGFLTMGLQFDSGASAATNVVTPIAGYQNYGQFSLIENSYFKQQAPLRTGEVIQCNWLPLDNTFLQFTSLGTGFRNCTFVGYASGAPVNTTIGRLDIILNYEGTVDLNWTDYIPQAIAFENNASLKYLPSLVNYLVDNNKTTNNADLKDAINNIVVDDKKDIIIPPTQDEIRQIALLQDMKNKMSEIVKEQLQEVLKDKKSSEEQKDKAGNLLDTIAKVMQYAPIIGPIAKGFNFLRNLF